MAASLSSIPERENGRSLVDQLAAIVGRRHCLTGDTATHFFRTGFRTGSSGCLAVVRPGSLVEQWRVVRACAAANVIVIMQAANTGLTGGSTPADGGYDREVVIVSTLRLTGIHLIEDGRQVVCLPGSTLFALERALKPLGREPHSVIGSSCIGASVFGGVCNNSGGALVRRGPAYTQLALFARMDGDGTVHLVNHLGIALGEDPETVLSRVERGEFGPGDIRADTPLAASDPDYGQHVRDIDAETPARFNADPRRLFEASGSAGRIILFALRLDTFPREAGTAVVCVGTQSAEVLSQIRLSLLADDCELPIAAEYIHRDAFAIAERYGKDMFIAIRTLGADRLPKLFKAKGLFDRLAVRLPFVGAGLSDRLMQALSHLWPNHLPKRFRALGSTYEHLLLIRVPQPEAEPLIARLNALVSESHGKVLACTPREGDMAFLHRFVTASAAVRYRAVHSAQVEDILALDIALPRNTREWFETLPPEFDRPFLHRLYYGHFLCHVFHQDYVVRRGFNVTALEHKLWSILDGRGAEYPAEHNVGHLYRAKPALADFYRDLDPCNAFNPGIGQTSRARHWAEP